VEKAPSKVFVFGKKVDNFRVVDYDQLFSMNIGATQQLAIENETLTKENETLMAENKSLETRLAALDRRSRICGSRNRKPPIDRSEYFSHSKLRATISERWN
jgi:hypothetical protein